MTLEQIREAITTAYDWHGGMSSPLYGFASARRVGSDDHRWGLIREIRACMASTGDNREHARLEALYNLVSAVSLRHEVCTSNDVAGR